MECYWRNGALCLRPQDEKERESLITLGVALRNGLNPHPDEAKPRYGFSVLEVKSKESQSS
jgi:hypothetical protein